MSDFETQTRFLSENGKRNLTVRHKKTNIKITSPDFLQSEKSDEELKKEVWEVMKLAIKTWEKCQYSNMQ